VISLEFITSLSLVPSLIVNVPPVSVISLPNDAISVVLFLIFTPLSASINTFLLFKPTSPNVISVSKFAKLVVLFLMEQVV
jgi:hypothetical protein